MKVLIVTPVEGGSGETITALHIAEDLTAHQHEVAFLASQFARYFIDKQFSNEVRQLHDDGKFNRLLWQQTVRDYQPDIVVFADYPLLFFSNGVAPLANERWVESLEDLPMPLVTLDHFGFGQKEMAMFFGPPHLSFHYEHFPATPDFMHILLPCPMHDPQPDTSRRGTPFSYWEVPLSISAEKRSLLRRNYVADEDDYLIFHSVPKWAWKMAQDFDLPYYEYLPQILNYYLGDLPKPVTVISVNNGELLTQPTDSRVSFVNESHLPKSDFEALMFSADLLLTENKMSISMAKAVCAGVPCAVLQNSYRYRQLRRQEESVILNLINEMEFKRPGAIYPYHVFPSGKEEFENIGLYEGNALYDGFIELEVYDAKHTKAIMQRLVNDEAMRSALQTRQAAYVSKLQQARGASETLECLFKERV